MKKLKVLFVALIFIFSSMSFIGKANAKPDLNDTDSDGWWGLKEMKIIPKDESDEINTRTVGFTGKGIKIGVVDAGIDCKNTEFLDSNGESKCSTGKIVGKSFIKGVEGTDFQEEYEYDGLGNKVFSDHLFTSLYLPSYHGTMVAGHLVGNSVGVAPDAKLYVAKTTPMAGDMALAIEWLISEGVDVISFSHSWTLNEESEGQKQLLQAIEDTKANNIIFVGGSDNTNYPIGKVPPITNTLRYPAMIDYVITSGAAEIWSDGTIKRSTEWENSETEYEMSGTGPLVDVVAPGSYIPLVLSSLYRDYANQTNDPNDPDTTKDYAKEYQGGTSTAAPYVAGIIALLLQQYPELSPKITKSLKEITNKLHEATTTEHLDNFGVAKGDDPADDGIDWEYGKGFVQGFAELPVEKSLQLNIQTNFQAYSAPSAAPYSDVVNLGVGNYAVDMAWKKLTNGEYEWYRIQSGTKRYWVKNDYIINKRKLDTTKTEGFYLIPNDNLYDYPSLNAPKRPYLTFNMSNTTIYPTYAFECYEKCTATDVNKKRYRWYQIDIGGKAYWYYKNYEKYQATSTNNGFDDKDIQTWEDYIGSPLVSQMKEGYYNSYAGNAFFEEKHLFNKEEYTNILNLYNSSFKYKYFIHASRGTSGQKEVYMAFSNSPLYNTGMYGSIKSTDGSPFRIFIPYNYYSTSYSTQLRTSYSDLWDYSIIEFIPISDQTFYEKKQIHLFQNYDLYDEPNGTKTGAITPQTINTVAKYYNWYQIQTADGLAWISVTDVIEGDLIIRLTSETLTFDAPKGNLMNQIILPQDVPSTNFKENWYEINLDSGKRWISPDNAIVVNPKTVSYRETLNEQKGIYELPFVDKGTLNTVSGSVHVNGEWVDSNGIMWLRISAAQGNQWIKKD